MSAFSRFAVVFLFAANLSAAPITGSVRDAADRPVAGVTIEVASVRSVQSAQDGEFSIDLPSGTYELRFSHPGFREETRSAKPGDQLVVDLQAAVSEMLTVSGIRADVETPVTKTTIGRQQIERQYHQQDIPLLMRDAPSINAHAESGVGGAGYSYITLRGIAANRINFTLDGVPLADSEDFGTYFVDFPDLAHSLESIQIQRGVGTSTVGSPSFGGSVNLESIDLSPTPQTEARVSLGSFGTRFATVGHQTGELPGGLALYTRASYSETDGFRDSSATRGQNIFFSGAKSGASSQLRFTGFTARERQQSSYYASDAETLRGNPRDNPQQPEEKDSFGYDLGHLQYLRSTSIGMDVTASAYYQRGYGWFRLFRDPEARTGLRDYGLDGTMIGSMVTASRRSGNFTTNFGVHANRFKREHSREPVGGPHQYFNYGLKREANAFAKVTWERDLWLLYGDAQVRRAGFSYRGDVDMRPIHWTFFNPKVGARLRLSPLSTVYASAGMSSREPTRSDMFLGEDNPEVALDLRAVKPERLYDFEAGFDYRTSAVTLAANVYAMEFRNEIAATGELSEIGLPLRRNVDRSSRRGVELEASLQASRTVRLRSSANVSRNRIAAWTQFYDVYDDAGEYAGSRPLNFRGVEPLLTPSVMLNQSIEYTPGAAFSAGMAARYVDGAYLDNTNNRAFTTPSFTVVDANVSFSLGRFVGAGDPRLSVQINNLLNNDRVFPSGYSYLYMNEASDISGIPYYYPQATRHVVVMLDFRL